MSTVFTQLANFSPLQALTLVLALAALIFLFAVAPVLALEAKAWFMRRRGVSPDGLAKWALKEAAKERRNPLIEIVKAIRGK